MSKKIWTAPIILDIVAKKLSRMSKISGGGTLGTLDNVQNKADFFYSDDFPKEVIASPTF